VSNWTAPRPRETWNDLDRGRFFREIWERPKWGTITFAPASVPASTAAVYVVAQSGGDVSTAVVVGLRKGMPTFVAWPSAPPAGLVVDCWCDGNDTLKIRFQNFSGAPVTPPAGAYAFQGTVI